MNKQEHTRKTLMNYSKEDLVEHCLCLEHNNHALKQQFEVQYANCMKIIDDMNLLNDTYRAAKEAGE